MSDEWSKAVATYDGIEAQARLLNELMESAKREQDRKAKEEAMRERGVLAAERQAAALKRIADRLEESVGASEKVAVRMSKLVAAVEGVEGRLADLLDVMPRSVLAAGVNACDSNVVYQDAPEDVAKAVDNMLRELLKHGAAK